MTAADQPTLIRRPEADGLPYRLGAHVVHDPASRRYPARALFAADQPIQSVEHRRLVPLYDQDGYGSCVSQAGHGVLSTLPWRHRYTSQQRILRVYGELTAEDPFPGTFNWRHPTAAGSEDTGTSVLTLGQHLKATRAISEYRWCFTLQDTFRAIQDRPLVVAFAWYRSMFRNPSGGTSPLRVDFTEPAVGGHALEANRLDIERRLIGGPNSWGGWGEWWLTWDDFDRLRGDDGDVMVMTQ